MKVYFENEIAFNPYFYHNILFSNEAYFWLAIEIAAFEVKKIYDLIIRRRYIYEIII